MDSFRTAVSRIYGSTERKERKDAEQWLEEWQRQPQAWQTADSILHDKMSNEEERYMAAQTIRTKTQRDFEELPSESSVSLRNSLVGLIISYCSQSRPVFVQLCVALSSLAVHLEAASFGDGGILGWLFGKLQQDASPEIAVSCMLEILVTLPQEVSSHRVAVRPERRRQAERELKASFGQAMQTMEAALQHSGDTVLDTVLRAFAQWLQLTNAQDVDVDTLRQSTLLRRTYEALAGYENFEAAVDVLDELVWCTVYFSDQLPYMKSNLQGLATDVVTRILALRPRFHLAVARARNEAAGVAPDAGLKAADAAAPHDDDDAVRAVVRLFLDTTEAYQALVASGRPDTIVLLEVVLEAASHPDFDIASLTLTTVGKIAARVQHTPSDGPEGRQRLQQVFAQIVTVLATRASFPPDYHEQPRAARNQFKRRRYELEDTLRDAVAVLGPAAVLERLVTPLQAMTTAAAAGEKAVAGAAPQWLAMEAAYFCIRALAGEGLELNNRLLLEVLQSIRSCPQEPQLQFTACTLVRKFACWLARSGLENPRALDLVPPLFQVVLSGLRDLVSAGGASLAFAALCTECSPTILQHCRQGVLQALQAAAHTETWHRPPPETGSAPTAGTLATEEEDVCSIIEGTAEVLGYGVRNHDAEAAQQLASCMALISQPAARVVQAGATNGNAAVPAGAATARAAATCALHRMSVLFQHLHACPQLVGEQLPQVWAFVQQVMAALPSETSVIESALRVIIKAMGSAAGNGSDVWLPGILHVIPQAYFATNCSAYLYLASHLVRTCAGAAAPQAPAVAAAVTPMIQHACSRLGSLAECNAHPEWADDLFLMAYKGVVHSPALFLQPELLRALLQVVAQGLLVRQPDAFKSMQSFLWRLLDERTLRSAPTHVAMQATLQELMLAFGAHLTRLQLAAVVGVSNESCIPDVAGTLLVMLRAFGQAGQQWLQDAAAQLPEAALPAQDRTTLVATMLQACHVDPSATEQFEQAVWSIQQALFELSATCRRNPVVRKQSERALTPQQMWQEVGIA